MTLSIETIYEVCIPLHNASNKVSCKQVSPANHFCDVTILFKFTANQIDRIDVNPSAVRKRMIQVYLSFLLYSSPVFKFSFKCEHSKCHTILISRQITLMLKCGVDKLLCMNNKIR